MSMLSNAGAFIVFKGTVNISFIDLMWIQQNLENMALHKHRCDLWELALFYFTLHNMF